MTNGKTLQDPALKTVIFVIQKKGGKDRVIFGSHHFSPTVESATEFVYQVLIKVSPTIADTKKIIYC
jgi:hypothetical protein